MDETENEDKFYDSLDEMPEFTKSRETSTTCLFKSDIEEIQSVADDSITTLIPFYRGEVIKADKVGPRNRSRRLKRTPKTLELLEEHWNKKQTDSYVALFRSRIGYCNQKSKKSSILDSARALDGDITRRTVEDVANNATEVFEDAQAETAEDTASFYEDILNNSRKTSVKSATSSVPMASLTSASLSTGSSVAQLHSVSEQMLRSSTSKCLTNRSRNCKKRVLLPEPVVGRLGPDILAMKEKLENWKKRQNYGLTASEKNRIKIRESKVLKELKAEVKTEDSS